MKLKETWKEYPINIDYEGFYRIEFSDLGNVKTYSKMYPDGKEVEGSIQGGYRILRSKLRKKWSERDMQRIAAVNEEIDALKAEIKALGHRQSHKEQVEELREKCNDLIQKRSKLNTKITNKNTINLAILFHKAVAELFLEKSPSKDKKFVIHKDFDKLNNEVSNLEWASQEDLDARLKKHPKMILREFKKQFSERKTVVQHSKLTEMEVLRIKTRLKKGDTLSQLARKFNVSDMQIHRIKTGENWSHVKLIEDIKEENSKK